MVTISMMQGNMVFRSVSNCSYYIYQYNSLSKVSDEDFITVTKGAFQRSYVFGQTSQIIFKNYPKTHLLCAHHLGIN